MQKIVRILLKYFFPFTEVLSKIGSWFLVMIMLVTVADVIGRKFFNMPVKGSLELISMFLVVFVFLNLPYNEARGGNVTVDTLYLSFGRKARKIVDIIMYVPFAGICVLFTWQLFRLAKEETASGNTAVISGIPTAPFMYIATAGFLVLTLAVFARLLLKIAEGGGNKR